VYKILGFLYLVTMTVIGFGLAPSFAQAQSPARQALIIANSTYDARFCARAIPDDDARLIAGALARAGLNWVLLF
jgi:hypothetical protein